MSKYYKAGHVEEIIKHYEELLSLPEWEINKMLDIHYKIERCIEHMKKHAEEEMN